MELRSLVKVTLSGSGGTWAQTVWFLDCVVPLVVCFQLAQAASAGLLLFLAWCSATVFVPSTLHFIRSPISVDFGLWNCPVWRLWKTHSSWSLYLEVTHFSGSLQHIFSYQQFLIFWGLCTLWISIVLPTENCIYMCRFAYSFLGSQVSWKPVSLYLPD